MCAVAVDGDRIPILVEDSLAIFQKRCYCIHRVNCRNGAGPRIRVHALSPLHGSLVGQINPPIHQHLGRILLVRVHGCRRDHPTTPRRSAHSFTSDGGIISRVPVGVPVEFIGLYLGKGAGSALSTVGAKEIDVRSVRFTS